MSWYVGAAGASGCFRVFDDAVLAELTDDLTGENATVSYPLRREADGVYLEMRLDDTVILWSRRGGEKEVWQIEFEACLLEEYGVEPDRYEDLGDGVYQVYVIIDGQSVPYVAVDSATGQFHG